jgi:AcrR family transcriptional regulator
VTQRKKKTKRLRRTADEARREILDAAEHQLRELGPAGIRLQQIAEDVGVSHPAVLHHFGSREGLIGAVVQRALERLEADLLAAIAAPLPAEQKLGEVLIDRAFSVLVGGGHARVVAWLSLSGQWQVPSETRIRAIAEAAHARRLELGHEEPPPTLEDTTFRMVLVALAIFGEAIAGDPMRDSAGIGGPGSADRFREWLVRLVVGAV